MPKNTRVHRCVEKVKAKGGSVNPYAVCQSATHQSFATGKPLEGKTLFGAVREKAKEQLNPKTFEGKSLTYSPEVAAAMRAKKKKNVAYSQASPENIDGKDIGNPPMSASGESTGGALVNPPAQRKGKDLNLEIV